MAPALVVSVCIHRVQLLLKLTGHSDAVTSVGFSETNKVVSGSEDKTLRLWNADTGQVLKQASHAIDLCARSSALWRDITKGYLK